MRTATVLSLALVVGLVSLGSSYAGTVLLIRHCARTTADTIEYGDESYTASDDYVHTPWAAWPDNTPAMTCTPFGLDIIQSTGRFLAANADLPTPIAVTADTVSRTIATAAALTKGMNLPGSIVKDNHDPFSSACSSPAHHIADAAISANLKAYPMPSDFQSNLAKLQQVTGTGVAPPMKDIPDTVHHGKWAGGVYVAQAQTERMLMQLGANMTVAWGLVTADEVYELSTLHAYQRFIEKVCPATQANYAASMTDYLLKSLDVQGTQIFVGHDDQMWGLAATLGMSWTTETFPILPTLPGSVLRFDIEDGMVTVSYHYPLLGARGSDMGQLETVAVTFNSTGTDSISVSALTKLGMGNIDSSCLFP